MYFHYCWQGKSVSEYKKTFSLRWLVLHIYTLKMGPKPQNFVPMSSKMAYLGSKNASNDFTINTFSVCKKKVYPKRKWHFPERDSFWRYLISKMTQTPQKAAILEGVSQRTSFLSHRSWSDDYGSIFINVGKEKKFPNKVAKFSKMASFWTK